MQNIGQNISFGSIIKVNAPKAAVEKALPALKKCKAEDNRVPIIDDCGECLSVYSKSDDSPESYIFTNEEAKKEWKWRINAANNEFLTNGVLFLTNRNDAINDTWERYHRLVQKLISDAKKTIKKLDINKITESDGGNALNIVG